MWAWQPCGYWCPAWLSLDRQAIIPRANRAGGRGSFWCYQTRASVSKWSGSMQETMSLSIRRKLSHIVWPFLRLTLALPRVYQNAANWIDINGCLVQFVEGGRMRPHVHNVPVSGLLSRPGDRRVILRCHLGHPFDGVVVGGNVLLAAHLAHAECVPVVVRQRGECLGEVLPLHHPVTGERPLS